MSKKNSYTLSAAFGLLVVTEVCVTVGCRSLATQPAAATSSSQPTEYWQLFPSQVITDAVPVLAKPLPLSAVRLTGGPLKHAQELDAAYLLGLDPDKMLYYLRIRAGLPPKGKAGYGGLSVAALPAALSSSNLFLLVDHSELKETYDSQSSSSRDDLIAKDGYHARLLRFTPDQRKPKEIQLKFEDPEGCPPLVAMNPDARKLFPEMPATWMSVMGSQLIMGVQVPRNANNQADLGVQIPQGMGFVMTHADHMVGAGHPPGIWEVSMSELNQAFAAVPTPAKKR